MIFAPVSLLAIAATLATSVVGTPVATTGDAAALVSSEIETRDLQITKRSYVGTCKSCTLKDSSLKCRCRNNAGVEVDASIDLNRCLANDNGVLVWRAGGGFYGSCGKQAPDFEPTEVNLNDRIHNNNGVLRCDV
ncbi:Cyanovirin-N [Rhypophila decipiens]